MGDKAVFDQKQVEKGITAVCKAMDELDLTMLERIQVTKSVYHAAQQTLDDGLEKFRIRDNRNPKE